MVPFLPRAIDAGAVRSNAGAPRTADQGPTPMPHVPPHRRWMVAIPALVVLVLSTACSSRIRPVGTWGAASATFGDIQRKDLRLAMEGRQEDTWKPFYPSPAQLAVIKASGEGAHFPPPLPRGLDARTSQPMLLVIAEPQWAAPPVMQQDDRDEVRFVLRERLYRYALRAYPHPVRVRWAYDPRDPLTRNHRIVTLQTRITDVGTGNGLARYLLGFGLGAASVQFEGEFLEGAVERHPIGAFVVRTAHAGYSQWGMNPQVYLASYCAKYAIESGVWKVMEHLPEHLPGAVTAPARPEDGGRDLASSQ